jgi:hypothetical protein
MAELKRMTDEEPKLIPFFAGKTEEGESIILYRRGAEIHIQLPNGKLWALPPEESEFTSWESPATERMYFKIESPVWSGTASGTRKDLVELQAH